MHERSPLDSSPNPAPSTPDVVARAARITGVLARRLVLLAWFRVRGRAPDLGEWLATTVSQLGPAFIKAAQLLSTRVDLLPPRVCHRLARLHDDVAPPPVAKLHPVLMRHLGALGHLIADQGGAPVACGSIACVYRVTSPDGRDLAVKSAQADFAREGARLGELHEHLDGLHGGRVPRPLPELCTSDVLVMEYLGGLDRGAARRLPADRRHRAVVAALHASYRILFRHGLVHCDLHPGNLYFRADGSMALVDAGFTVRLTPYAQTKFTAFFYCMSLGDGPACADAVLSTATPGRRTDTDGFRRELAWLVDSHSGVRAADFDLVSFVARLFDSQRRYGLYAHPQFHEHPQFRTLRRTRLLRWRVRHSAHPPLAVSPW